MSPVFFLNKTDYRLFKSLLAKTIKSIKKFYLRKDFVFIQYNYIYYLGMPMFMRLKYTHI